MITHIRSSTITLPNEKTGGYIPWHHVLDYPPLSRSHESGKSSSGKIPVDTEGAASRELSLLRQMSSNT